LEGAPGCAPLEEEIEARGGGGGGSAGRAVDEAVKGELDAVLEGEGGRD
jgi:hypothetical protein